MIIVSSLGTNRRFASNMFDTDLTTLNEVLSLDSLPQKKTAL